MWNDRIDELKRTWTDRYVRANPDREELKRFGAAVGRVVTVNCSGKALVDFADGGWYDVPADEGWLKLIDDEEGAKEYKGDVNSAQARPARQG